MKIKHYCRRSVKFEITLPIHLSRKEPWNGENLAIEMQLRVPIKAYKRYVVACCPALDVCSQGDSEKSAKKALGEALVAFFTSCLERGVLDEVLKGCGFKAVRKPKKSQANIFEKDGFQFER